MVKKGKIFQPIGNREITAALADKDIQAAFFRFFKNIDVKTEKGAPSRFDTLYMGFVVY